MPPGFLTPPNVGSTGPASIPTANPGMMADAVSKVREAVRILEMCLPQLPAGSEEHKVVLKMITDGSKIAPPSSDQHGVQMTTIADLGQNAMKSQMLQQLLRNQGQGGGSAPGAQPQLPPGMVG
ncbi:MAG: hypothetical protein KGL39_39085 [Patescibacteria group bacterium]|nr:hypothetical protein [Patescibacteria group bacterium]